MCPQLEGSSPEKTLPSFHLSPAQPEKKQNCFTLVCRFTLLFPLGDSMYAAVAGASWSPSPLGKKKACRRLCPFFPLAEQGLGQKFFLQPACADCRWKLASSPLAEDFRVRWPAGVENWKSKSGSVRTLILFCDLKQTITNKKKPTTTNTTKQMLLHHTEGSGLASRCLSVDHLAFCSVDSLKDQKRWPRSELKKKKVSQKHETPCPTVPW